MATQITKTIVVLANSVKHHQHCVAGKCVTTGQWIRPVSNASGAELSDQQVTFRNPMGQFKAKPLQKIEMTFSAIAPLAHQPENHVVDQTQWVQRYRVNPSDLPTYLDNPADLWGTGDRVSHTLVTSGRITITQSLYLIQVNNLRLHRRSDGKRRAEFVYNGITYDLAVTDPNFDSWLGAKTEGESIRILCISLGEEFEGFCYKLVATIF